MPSIVRLAKVFHWWLIDGDWWTHPDVKTIREGLYLDPDRPIVGYEREAYERERKEKYEKRLKNDPHYRQGGMPAPARSRQSESVIGSAIPSGGGAIGAIIGGLPVGGVGSRYQKKQSAAIPDRLQSSD